MQGLDKTAKYIDRDGGCDSCYLSLCPACIEYILSVSKQEGTKVHLQFYDWQYVKYENLIVDIKTDYSNINCHCYT